MPYRLLRDRSLPAAEQYVGHGKRPRIEVTARHLRQGWAEVIITDNGIGIPADQTDKIFNSFHRAHRYAGYKGTGLRLSICKRIVERHGGAIWVTDNPCGGSQFHVALPVPADPASLSRPEPQTPAAATLSKAS